MIRRKSVWLLPLLVVTLGIAVLGLGCGGDETGVKTYQDPEYGFSFEYPAGWKVDKDAGYDVTSGAEAVAAVAVGDPKGAKVDDTGLDLISVQVYQLNQTIDAGLLQAVLAELEAVVAGLQSQDPTMTVEEPLTETSVGGAPGYQTTATFDWDADHRVKTTSYFIFTGDIEYQLVVQAAADNWDKNKALFDAFVASFKPGNQ